MKMRVFNHGLSRMSFANARSFLGFVWQELRSPQKGQALAQTIRVIRGSIMVMVAAASLCLQAAEPTIAVKATPRYPWSGMVDVVFTITGDSGLKYDTSFVAKNVAGGTNITMKTLLDTKGTVLSLTNSLAAGSYKWGWDASADLPAGFVAERVAVVGNVNVSAFPYSVKFNANGGTGTMANESFTYGTAKALSANAFTRSGYTFQGWAKTATGSKAYSDKQTVCNLTTTANGTVNLYAVWEKELGGVQLWANGPYWAECNIGATKPEAYGYYFCWGGTIGYYYLGDTVSGNNWKSSDGSRYGSFSEDDCPTFSKSNATLRSSGYINSAGNLVPAYDAATVYLGTPWRMPTKAEVDALVGNCDTKWTTRNGVYGRLVSGRGSFSAKSIFLPAAGYGDWGLLYSRGVWCKYWTSTPSTRSDCNWYAWYLSSDSSGFYCSDYFRYEGRTVRPVRNNDQ